MQITCLHCEITFKTDDKRSKFCSRKCSATYNNLNNHWRDAKQQRSGGRRATCLHCKTTYAPSKNVRGIFCSIDCFKAGNWLHRYLPKVLAGTAGPASLRTYHIYTHGEICRECGTGAEHNGKFLRLQLDHIDGNSDNNTVDNTRLLCPNCHSQTENFGSKGVGNRYKKHTKRNIYLQKYKALAG